MKQRLSYCVLAVLAAALMVPPAWSQSMATVKGKAADVEGKPIVGATVEYSNQDTGQKYNLKTNKKGEFFSLGIAPGKYKISLIQNGQVLFFFNGVQVQLGSDENVTDFNLQKEQAAAKQKAESQMTEQQKEQQAKIQKENTTIKTLNEKLAAASAAEQAGNYDQAVAVLKDATTIDPNRDLLWFKLGDAYRGAATKQTDAAQKTQNYNDSIAAYQKALAIKPNDGAYLNNLGDVEAKAGKTDDSIKTFTQAAQADPIHAAQYYFNLGAVLTNSGKMDDAVQAFDKAIAADPTKADAYYWKGVNLLGKATTDKAGKMTAPPGTAEAFDKYLELQPQGTYADAAKQMLASIGASVETSFGKSKKKTSKRQ
ncbi:MAG: tetratricopeptide repeat protein [Acidobacteriota bacterium]